MLEVMVLKPELRRLLDDIKELEKMPEIEKQYYCGERGKLTNGKNMYGMRP